MNTLGKLTRLFNRPRHTSERVTPVLLAADPMHAQTISVTPITNGYLVSTIKQNAPRLAFAPDLNGVKELIAREVAQLRFDI